jgi:excisionase family DNA binding protein
MSELTVKEFAAVERVDERTVRRWISKGAVEVRRTPGGGVRIPASRNNAILTPDGPRMANADKSGHPAA